MRPRVPGKMARHKNRSIDCGDLSPFKQWVKCFLIALGSASSGQGTLSCWHMDNSSWFIYHLLLQVLTFGQRMRKFPGVPFMRTLTHEGSILAI